METFDTNFGSKAFWDYTPDNYLQKIGDIESYELRKLMKKITKYSREQNLCEKFRKTDKQYLEFHS